MGQPSRVVALGGRYAKEFFTVEDNAVLVLGYQRGHSICEGTWTQPAVPGRIPTMLYGTDGAIAIAGQTELQVAVPKYPWTDLAYSLAPSGHGGGPSGQDLYEASTGHADSDTGSGFPLMCA